LNFQDLADELVARAWIGVESLAWYLLGSGFCDYHRALAVVTTAQPDLDKVVQWLKEELEKMGRKAKR
jgi:hypothetical protein